MAIFNSFLSVYQRVIFTTRSWMILQSWSTCAKDKFPDWSKILEAGAAAGADAMSGGIGKVTSQIGNAITDLDSQVGCHCWDWNLGISVILRFRSWDVLSSSGEGSELW